MNAVLELGKRKIKRTFRKIIRQASPDELSDGRHWYLLAGWWIDGVAVDNHIPREIVCGVLSALSPSVEWESNKKQAEKLIYGYLILSDVDGVVITTYKQQLSKAIAILDLIKGWQSDNDWSEGYILAVLGGRAYKTKSFYHNILNPLDRAYVTIDTHIWNAAGLITKFINKGEYEAMSEIIRELSDEFGYEPCILQAIIWVVYKRISKDLPI
jgi:hypothetical protein